MKEVKQLRAKPEIAWGMTQSSASARDLGVAREMDNG